MTISSLTAPPALPDRTEQDQTVFDTRMAAYWAYFKEDFEPELNTITGEIDTVSTTTEEYKTAAEAAQAAAELAETNAEAAETGAEAARDAAAASANATIWLVGTTYSAGDVVLDPGDSYRPYIAQQSTTGDTPNTDDGTNWVQLYLKVAPGQITLGPSGQTFSGYLEMDGSTILAASYPNLSGFDLLQSFPFAEATSSGVVLSTSIIYGVCYGETTYVCVGYSGVIAYSSDGDTWTAATDSGTVLGTNTIRAVCYGNSIFVCVGDAGVIGYSSDGDTWTVATSSKAQGNDFDAVTYDATIGKFVAAGESGEIWYSTDGDTWTQASNSNFMSGTGHLYGVISDGSKYCAVGQVLVHSTDGDEWVKEPTTNFISTPTAITYGSNLFVAVDSIGGIVYSVDGISWFPFPSFVNATLKSVCYGNSKFVAVGYYGIIGVASISATNLYLPPAPAHVGFSAYIEY